ncbi:hypothetical protein HF086_015399 [Spodoptera exigua]|uniref:Uncharacterized protein n=1 Tax=Spodoptera exigua TaxID=7107 RepID=A0A922M9T3_SPOEX|nr:hypothetical protein HF086_015399 [Spodoptera exigua]
MALDGTKRHYVIPRVRLMFKADDPETFAQRVKFAVDLRKEVENNLRTLKSAPQLLVASYSSCSLVEYIDASCIHCSPVPFLNGEIRRQCTVDRIDSAPGLSKSAGQRLGGRDDDVELLYTKMEGKMKIIDTILKYKDLYNFIDVPTPDYVPPVPLFGRLPCVMEDFSARLKHNQWYSLYVLMESVACIQMVVDECLKVESMLFFTNNYGRNASLAEFDAAQQHCTSMVMVLLFHRTHSCTFSGVITGGWSFLH